MNGGARFGGYLLGLAAVFGGALAIGSVAGSEPPKQAATHGGMTGHGTGHDAAEHDVEGLAVAAGGYTFAPATTSLPAGRTIRFAFRILDTHGTPVTAFDDRHERKLHFIVVRRDTAGYQHLHPTMDAAGTWTVPLRLATAGSYKAYADFDPAGDAPARTLAVDLSAAGSYVPAAIPAPARTATVAGYRVALIGRLIAGHDSTLAFSVTRGGRPVRDLQPYLGAYGHLVALRSGDLAYLHVHPEGAPGDGTTRPGPDVTFQADVPTAGRYRLFLDFQHAGRVHTAAFTVDAGADQ